MSITSEITRIKNAKSNLISTIRDKGVEISDNTSIENIPDIVDTNLEKSGGSSAKTFTGHYDTQGLKAIGWSDEEIQYYQDNGVQWDAENDDIFKLTESELARDDSSATRFLPKNSTVGNFNGYYSLIAIPETNRITTFNTTFNNCYCLTTIPLVDTGNMTSFASAFYNCTSLEKIPQLDTSNVTSFNSAFTNCHSLKTIPLLNTSKGALLNGMFQNCTSLKTIPQLNVSKGGAFTNMFNGCFSLVEVPSLNTIKSVNFSNMFKDCCALKTLGELNGELCMNVTGTFQNCHSLENFDGIKDQGAAYLTTANAKTTAYSLTLSYCTRLTHDSLISIINNLYDIGSKGCRTQNLILGDINLAKLSAEEIAIATNKGWTVL